MNKINILEPINRLIPNSRMKKICMVTFCASFIAFMTGIEQTASVPAMIVMLVMAHWYRQEERWEEIYRMTGKKGTGVRDSSGEEQS